MDGTKLIRLIESRFKNSIRPANQRIFSASADGTYIEWIEHIYFDTEWQDLDFKKLQKYSNYQIYLSPEGLKYYLPGYIKCTLEHMEALDTFAEALIFYMTPPNKYSDTWLQLNVYPQKVTNFVQWTSELSCREIECFTLFLEYLIAEYPNDIVDEYDLEETEICLEYWKSKCP